MSAAGCRKNAIFGVDSNPWGPRHPSEQKNSIKIEKKSFVQQQDSISRPTEFKSSAMPLDQAVNLFQIALF